jgi:F-type H+-transporting ATPase subunit beta
MILGMEELSEEDKFLEHVVFNFLSQPFHVAEQFTGLVVDIKDTIKGFNMIIDGELDHLLNQHSTKGTIEEAIEAGEKIGRSLKQVRL